MILVNTDYISGKELEMLGLVKGSTIQSKHLGKDIAQAFKTLVGSELKAYNDMMNEAQAIATKRMVAEAEALGADAVVNVHHIVARLELAQLLQRKRYLTASGTVATEVVFMESVEYLMVGKETTSEGMIGESFV